MNVMQFAEVHSHSLSLPTLGPGKVIGTPIRGRSHEARKFPTHLIDQLGPDAPGVLNLALFQDWMAEVFHPYRTRYYQYPDRMKLGLAIVGIPISLFPQCERWEDSAVYPTNRTGEPLTSSADSEFDKAAIFVDVEGSLLIVDTFSGCKAASATMCKNPGVLFRNAPRRRLFNDAQSLFHALCGYTKFVTPECVHATIDDEASKCNGDCLLMREIFNHYYSASKAIFAKYLKEN